MILKYIYTLFLGIILSAFVGVGIAAFYPEPKYPEFPPSYYHSPKINEQLNATQSAEQLKKEDEMYKAGQEHQKKSQKYNRNVSIVSLVAATSFWQ